MALRPSPDAADIGPVEADASGRVVRITSVVPSDEGLPGTHFTGVHAISRAAIAQIPAVGEQCVVRTTYKALVPAGSVGHIAHTGAWVDVGRPDSYLEANMAVLDGLVPTPIDPWTLGERGPGGSWVGKGASIAGVVEHSVVGAGATVPAGTSLTNSVVWDGVRVVPGEYRDAIVYGSTEDEVWRR